MKYILVLVSILFLTGCKEAEPDGSGTLRHEIFLKCMDLAKGFDTKLEQLSLEDASYDGIADIIDTCSSTAYYQANHITNKG